MHHIKEIDSKFNLYQKKILRPILVAPETGAHGAPLPSVRPWMLFKNYDKMFTLIFTFFVAQNVFENSSKFLLVSRPEVLFVKS